MCLLLAFQFLLPRNLLLKKHFDIEKVVGTSDSGNDTESIYVYEKGDSEVAQHFHAWG
jgi:hypothetical protein